MTEDKNNNKTEFFTDAFILSLLVSTAQICQIIYTDCQGQKKKTIKKLNTHRSSGILLRLLYSIFCLHQALSTEQQQPQDQ
jgi:hypothetical protein